MKKCSVINCSAPFANNQSNLTFYRFPANKEECKKWLSKCGLEETLDCSQSFVCSRHFDENDFQLDLDSRLLDRTLKKNLKIGSVPHLNLFEIKQEPPEADEVEFQGRSKSPYVNLEPHYTPLEPCKHVS
ncbi:cellular tumor antigen p53 [Trichonephila clavata]|uniref:Cellular tumor antigen p53 n=1 Tax=Trichonephila clavata TaxID=2740835 RepID=A0A8X6HV51_TRICU|nr:cellular tumor antigen p53 [Trichonephila clavata]